jgi:hypothetical protein
VTLSLIYVVYAIPLGIATYFAQRDLAHMLQIFTGALQTQARGGPPMDPNEIVRKMGEMQTPGAQLWSFGLLGLAFFFSPLPTAALIEAVTAYYLGRVTSFSAAYRVALGRYLNLFGVNVLFLMVGGAAYIVLIIAGVILGLVFGLLISALHTAGIVLTVFVVAILLVLFVAFALVVTLAVQVAYFTCVIERQNLAVSFVRGLSRTFAGIGLRRSLLAGLLYVAIAIGIGIVSSAGDIVLVGLVRSEVAGAAYETLLSIATAAFTTAFMAVFYVDLRVREEGLDLRLAAENANAPLAPPPAPA